LLITILAVPFQSVDRTGTIRGIVVNGSQNNAPVAGGEAVLQVQQDDTFIPLATTSTDEQGSFIFDEIPVEDEILFLPGASHDGVYYPGKRVRIGPSQPNAVVRLVVHDAVMHPSPLVALRHDIVVRPEPGILTVTETILVSNPSLFSYVGDSGDGQRPVTLRLGIPSNFEKVTFHKEFFGRRFVLIEGSLLTDIPWPPGERELEFHYILPIEKQQQVWARPLDLPCADVRVRVVTTKPNEVACNLSAAARGPNSDAMFESHNSFLLAGHVIRLELGRLPVPWMARARWIALSILAGLVVAVVFVIGFLRRQSQLGTGGARTPRGIHRKAECLRRSRSAVNRS
jgi:hypothetical protein